MSYLALYRKFRPTDFDSVVEQKHITTTLKNQIINDRVGHAYLFCGTRGTGKTSIAKIFAKAVNCENPINGNPCGKCPTCLALSRPDNMDIIEIDAASNNGVDDLRDLRDKVAFQPTVGKYKVYIIDEVHMLSSSAFNALLKTLEEPPAHVIFILATTEVQKIPATILSRCMRFDFRLISTDKIFEYLKKVYKSVNKDFEEDALFAIARAGEGSMRDALSIADICLSLSDGKLKFSDVSQVLGNLSRESLYDLFNAISAKDAGLTLNMVNEFIANGKSPSIIAKDFAQLFRDLLIIKLSDKNNALNYPEEVIEKYTEFATISDSQFLLRGLEVFGELENKFRYSLNQRLVLETAFLKMSDPTFDISVLSLTRRVGMIENALKEGKAIPQKTFGENEDNFNQSSSQNNNSSNTNQNSEQTNNKKDNIDKAKIDDSKIKVINSNCKGLALKALREKGDYPLFSAISFANLVENLPNLDIFVTSKDNKDFLSEKDKLSVLNEIAASLGYEKVNIIVQSNEDQQKMQKIINNANKLTNNSLQIKE